MTPASSDILILRELAKRYLDICHHPDQQRRRDQWRKLNSLKSVGPLIYIRACAWSEMPQSQCRCSDPFFREYEDFFRLAIFRDTFADDFIFEPWVTVQARRITPPSGLWGVPITWTHTEENPSGAGKWDSAIREESDLDKLVVPHHQIDETKTATAVAKLHDAIGDVIPINVDRGPEWRMWSADISTHLAQLRGLEQIMWDMTDRPQWLHRLLAFMRDGVLTAHAEAEAAGDWTLCNHQNQAMPYARELHDPAANSPPVPRSILWWFCASQELTLVGPEMWDEFMLQYQIPIIEQFGLSAYGCCEDLSVKIPRLRRIRNLRRIAVSPFANVARCAEQIGRDYVISYRPSPADMVGYGFDEGRIRSILRRDLAILRGLRIDITLKDVETVQGDENRIRNWVRVAREVIEEVWKE